jgi:putative Mg2+ transporter-C (MgtC) family protein
VGIAIGAGSMVGAAVTTVLVVIVLEILPRIESLYHLGPTAFALTVKSLDKPGQVGRIGSYFGSQGIHIKEIHIEPLGEGIILIPLTVVLPHCGIVDQMIADLAGIEGILGIIKE